MSFKQYVFTRKYGFGRGSRESWEFITRARGDARFPDAKSWPELRAYLMSCGMPEEMVRAARRVWGSYQSRRDRGKPVSSTLASRPHDMPSRNRPQPA